MINYFIIGTLLSDILSQTPHYFKFDPVITNHEIDNTNNYTIFKSFNATIKIELTAKIYKMDTASRFSQPDVYFWIESKCDGNWNMIPGTKEYFDIYVPGTTDVYYSVAFNSTKDFRIAYKVENLIYNYAVLFAYDYLKYPRGRLFISVFEN